LLSEFAGEAATVEKPRVQKVDEKYKSPGGHATIGAVEIR
jgi:hypothetical protein